MKFILNFKIAKSLDDLLILIDQTIIISGKIFASKNLRARTPATGNCSVRRGRISGARRVDLGGADAIAGRTAVMVDGFCVRDMRKYPFWALALNCLKN